MEEPEDCVISNNGEGIYYRMFLKPVTTRLKNEMDCMQFHIPSFMPIEYHEHSSGTETFFVSQGKFLCNCMGRGFVMGAGDVLHIQPWMGHGFNPIEPESRLNILFMGIDQQFALTQPIYRLRAGFPGLFTNSDFNEVFHQSNSGTEKRSLPAPNEVPPEQVQQLRLAGIGLREHEFDGIKLHLKVARYETEGVKEIWELLMKPGFYCDWNNFLPVYRFFYVTEGKVRCYVRKTETETLEFDAVKENIIMIPPYNPFRFEVIEEARMYDMDCPARLQDLCEEIETLALNNPGQKADKEAILALSATYGLNCTDIGYKA